MTKRLRIALPLVLALVLALALPAAPIIAQEGVTTIAEGFNGPQGVLVDPDGNVWVVDSGLGGDAEMEMLDPATGVTATVSYGESARITKIDPNGVQTDIAMLPSTFANNEGTGGARLALLDDELYVTSGAWLGDGVENAAPTITNTAALLKVNEDGTLEQVAPLWRIEKRMNPDNTIFESHPYGVAASPDGKLWVTDAAGNTLLRVDPNSSVVELVTTFPAIPGVFPNPNRGGEMLTDPVPTGLAFDDDGNALVSLLSGAPFVPGSSSVIKVTPAGVRSDYATNLTMLTDIRRGPDGEFYAVQFGLFTDQGPTPNSGAIIKIAEGEGSVPVIEGLSFPTSIDFDADGNAYVTINGLGAPGSGAVVKFDGVADGQTYTLTGEVAEEATEEATVEPTEEATEEATEEPTEEATEEATVEPTEEATEEPTEEATAEAAAVATEEPTEEPTATATAEPTATATTEPTATATTEPTATATTEPTATATTEPTATATTEPTATATAEPTATATAEPTATATAEPTATATAEPTATATAEPTAEPTVAATEEPTAEAVALDVPSVEAVDQVSDGTQVTIDNVVATQDGWLVIHADADGKPGPVLGQTAVAEGSTNTVIVVLDEPVGVGTPLWAMLHVDEGVQGVYEFPGADVPVLIEDAIVMMPFSVVEEVVEEATAVPTEEATEEPAEEATEEPTVEAAAEATSVPTEEATEEPTAEAAAEATAVPTEEATEEPTVEAAAEATVVATEEASEEPVAESTVAPTEEAAAPASLPNTGAALPSMPSVIAIVLAVGAALAGGVSLRRRQS